VRNDFTGFATAA